MFWPRKSQHLTLGIFGVGSQVAFKVSGATPTTVAEVPAPASGVNIAALNRASTVEIEVWGYQKDHFSHIIC